MGGGFACVEPRDHQPNIAANGQTRSLVAALPCERISLIIPNTKPV